MAGERGLLREVQQLLQQAGLGDRWQQLVGSWLNDALPAEPAEGPEGRAQLVWAADLLDQVSADVASLTRLQRQFEDGFTFVDGVSATLLDTGDVAERAIRLSAADVQAADDWATRLSFAAGVIREFAETDGNAS